MARRPKLISQFRAGADHGAEVVINRDCLTATDVAKWRAAGRIFSGDDRRAPLRDALIRHGQWAAGQTAGRFYPMACVALEVTQRCNLDCSLCYLSDLSEAAHDLPLTVLLDRLEMIASHYGPGTSVQLSGGDPTLRKLEDLEELCRVIRARGMRSCLMTNGIKATRALLQRLANAGLDDVAFHVDMTQERKGVASEAALNALRLDYLERAAGLGLRVLFNTTVFDGNLAELPVIAAFFREQAHRITLVSFQMQADTGRGVLRERKAAVTPERVSAALDAGFSCSLDLDAAHVGHRDCTRYGSVLVAGGVATSALANLALGERLIEAMSAEEKPTHAYTPAAATLRRVALRQPGLTLALLAETVRLLWRLRAGLWRSRGNVGRMAVMIHNFMDARQLDPARCETCVFMVMTEDGPLSMCVHNAQRDAFVFRPARIETTDGPRFWSAADGSLSAEACEKRPAALPIKRLKGRWRLARQHTRNAERVA